MKTALITGTTGQDHLPGMSGCSCIAANYRTALCSAGWGRFGQTWPIRIDLKETFDARMSGTYQSQREWLATPQERCSAPPRQAATLADRTWRGPK
jgi:hypothetical protein